jgi:RNA-binding protein NOB1
LYRYTPDGMRITNLRRWVLRCHACGDITRQTTRVFCPKCGNNALQKVEHTVTAEGVEQFGVRRKHILRGGADCLPTVYPVHKLNPVDPTHSA